MGNAGGRRLIDVYPNTELCVTNSTHGRVRIPSRGRRAHGLRRKGPFVRPIRFRKLSEMFIVLVLTNYFGCKEHQDRRLSPYHQAGRVVFLGHRTLCAMGSRALSFRHNGTAQARGSSASPAADGWQPCFLCVARTAFIPSSRQAVRISGISLTLPFS